MSMSQEEIEALMNGLDIGDDESDSDEVSASPNVNIQEIEELLSQTENLKENIEEESIVKAKVKEETFELDNIEDLLNNNSSDLVANDEIDDLLKDIESSPLIDELDELSLSSVVNEESVVEETKATVENVKFDHSDDEIVKSWTSSKINEGVIPLPAEKDTKVVNQLSQVANDSEEKVSQIFDVLSLSLDNNSETKNKIKDFEAFITAQTNLLSSLNSKFPNISVFNENLNSISKISEDLNTLKSSLDDEDNHIFEAMELMQFNDINRQKIERVMSVIRKLSAYLNNLFEDDGSRSEVAVAKHIHGDDTNDLIGDDLDRLIEEFSHKD